MCWLIVINTITIQHPRTSNLWNTKRIKSDKSVLIIEQVPGVSVKYLKNIFFYVRSIGCNTKSVSTGLKYIQTYVVMHKQSYSVSIIVFKYISAQLSPVLADFDTANWSTHDLSTELDQPP